MKVPTRLVRYKNGGHHALINVTDFDPALHEDPTSKPTVTPAPVPARPAPEKKKTPAKKTPVRRTRR